MAAVALHANEAEESSPFDSTHKDFFWLMYAGAQKQVAKRQTIESRPCKCLFKVLRDLIFKMDLEKLP
jgi:hypothetical protein